MYQSQHGFDHIRQKVYNMAGSKKSVSLSALSDEGDSSIIVPKTEQKKVVHKRGVNFMTLFLGTVIFFMSIATFYAATAAPSRRIAQRPQQRPTPVDTRPVIDSGLQTWMDQVDRRIYKMEKSLAQWNHRVWLLAIAQNENASINMQVDRDFHNGRHSHKYIKFDHNWKMNRAPDTMRLTEEQKRNMVR